MQFMQLKPLADCFLVKIQEEKTDSSALFL